MYKSVEELLIVRIKVIDDYPFSIYKIGQVIEIGFAHLHSTTNNLKTYTKYPNIFRVMEWWEERKEGDIEYAFDYENGGIGKVIRILDRGLCITWKDNLVSWENCKPATEAEYKHYESTINRFMQPSK